MASGLPQQVLAHIWLEILLHDATYHPLHNQFIYLHECCVILSWSALLVWNNHNSSVKNSSKKGWLASVWHHGAYKCIVSVNDLLLCWWHFGSGCLGSLHFNSVVRRVYVCCVQLYAIVEHFIFLPCIVLSHNSYDSTQTCLMLFYFSLRGLCDTTGQGRLNSEQFALAMYLIHQKVMGVDPPQALQPEMVPPSMRSGSAASPAGGEERVRFSFL